MARLDTPVMVVNFKVYHEASGDRALTLTKTLEKIAKDTGVNVVVAPQMTDLNHIAEQTNISVYAQHVDDCEPGAQTGHVTAEAIKDAGAAGSLLNHSERRLRLSAIEWVIKRLHELGLQSIVCANTPEVGAASAVLRPTAVAIEPPELIGSGMAVSKAKPGIVSDTVRLIKAANPKVIVLCGAGIVTGNDATAALKLGAEGILVSSGIVKARNPGAAALDLAMAMK